MGVDSSAALAYSRAEEHRGGQAANHARHQRVSQQQTFPADKQQTFRPDLMPMKMAS
jgi:hypothetical protein